MLIYVFPLPRVGLVPVATDPSSLASVVKTKSNCDNTISSTMPKIKVMLLLIEILFSFLRDACFLPVIFFKKSPPYNIAGYRNTNIPMINTQYLIVILGFADKCFDFLDDSNRLFRVYFDCNRSWVYKGS